MASTPTHRLPTVESILQQGVDQGIHPGAQVFVAQHGQTVADFAIGEARDGVPMETDSLTLWLSACKPIGAIAIAQLVERWHVGLDDLVCDFIPEFVGHGKQAVTVRHLLTHTAGLRYVDTGWPFTEWSEIIERLCQTGVEPHWTPGLRARYDQTNSWVLLAEIIRRADGRLFENYVRDEIFLPLKMNDCWIGMPEAQAVAYRNRLALLYATNHQPRVPLAPYDRMEGITRCRPGANARGPARQFGRFYQMLLNGGVLDGVRIVRPETVREFTTAQRVGMFDETFRHKIDWGLGFLICSNHYHHKALPYGFGPHASDRAFGHNGFQSAIGFADPDYELVVIIIPNGAPGEPAHDRRLRQVLAAVYEDMGLALRPR